MSESRLQAIRVIYVGPVDRELDTELLLILRQHGWTGWTSGYSYSTHERELCFEKLLRAQEPGEAESAPTDSDSWAERKPVYTVTTAP